jgi:carboxymethylenebutenolidase
MIIKEEFADIETPTGPMRLHLFRPAAAGRYPGILLYSEIDQITGPIRPLTSPAISHSVRSGVSPITEPSPSPNYRLCRRI